MTGSGLVHQRLQTRELLGGVPLLRIVLRVTGRRLLKRRFQTFAIRVRRLEQRGQPRLLLRRVFEQRPDVRAIGLFLFEQRRQPRLFRGGLLK